MQLPTKVYNIKHSSYQRKLIKHFITNYDVFAYETMVWQCSVEDHMKSCFKAIFQMITTIGGICDSSWQKIMSLNLIETLINIPDRDSRCDDLVVAII